MTGQAVVIVGAGTAGHHVAGRLRDNGFEGSVTLIGAEPHLPYHRPPLSKAYLAGATPRERLGLRSPEYYVDHAVTTRVGVSVEAIDREGRRIALDDGTAVGYDCLVLAPGASPRQIDLPGRDLRGVVELRTCDDADRLREHLHEGRRVVVVGGGFIGLEVAAAARKRGASVTVLEAMPALMTRALSGTTARLLADTHASYGVRISCTTSVVELVGEDGQVSEVVTSSGERLPADAVVLGVGVVPNTSLAADAGLTTGDGVVVDDRLRTADPAVFAVGDCASFPDGRGAQLRLESVQNAVDQAHYVADRICSDSDAGPYRAVPYFWTDQYDTKLQIVGYTRHDDHTVVRGGSERHSVFRFADGELAAVESINDPSTHLAVRRILAGGGTVSIDQATGDTDLRALARSV
ncbi:FAD-dependent oxidoreductase [Gordonia humi]|uniref:3-phenylpropionate/trans-cinnamate dioxygenase ferredoxin reductase subunit n=1 Tax=Gordonia humi TaxID=686429 RepID=A0A840F1K5_9ACTN|nr:3-phenylpropionate/trans-cinnamate dioxygenase ferredoxin reductase subunit [Gordonia humi]